MRSLVFVCILAGLVLAAAAFPACADEAPQPAYSVGLARVDITPDYPVRLSGFGSRRTESEGVTHKIYARALAIDDGEPAVVLAIDSLGVSIEHVNELGRRLEKKAKLKRERLAVTATHTHTAPMLAGTVPTLFGVPIPKEHQDTIDRYTREFLDNLEKAALLALENRKPARLSRGIGVVTFANNRRTKGGPVDHDLPVLVVKDLKGKLRGIWVNYTCHCVTLSNNKISGDWAGYAAELLQTDHPGTVALVSIGCGADANPSSGVTGDKKEIALRQGGEIATEVKRLLGGYLAPVTGKISARSRSVELPLKSLPTREEWEAKAKRNDAVGHHARVNLARLDRGEALRTKIDYPMQTWTFGDSLAMVFLPGEVVVDYSLRLKRELDGQRLWINAYSNDSPCYIPSERILKEGGYEGGGAMIYYDVPVPFQPGLEQKIIDAVHEQIGKGFKAPRSQTGVWERDAGSLPLSPQQSLAAIKTKDDLQVQLVAAEPLVIDPVAISFGPDGRLWVAEMHDYPTGLKGDFKPGGRIKVLRDRDGDGVFDEASVFLDNIPFPTGVTVWRNGILVCAAPDILYAEDTNGDGKADVVRKLFSGFGTENYQGRVNSLEYGLDGWVYGSCGLFGGKIECRPLAPREVPRSRSERATFVHLGDRDFRIKPDEGILEPATGRSQQGRVRDDWGNWFGCDNSNLCRHYPLADHYLRRNPHVVPPASSVNVPDYPNGNRLFPIQSQAQLFKLSGPLGHTTSACGLGIYRDDLLGKEYTGNTFTCEPVNLLVHRLQLTPKGSTFSGRRAQDEPDREFLASTDPWFRPVQVRTGPDGCLWVVDMYRFVIEHPRWIPPADLAKVDVRAGSTLGRIYRIRPRAKEPRPVRRLDSMDTKSLVAALDSPNGCQRDLAHMMLLWRGDKSAVELLRAVAVDENNRAEARLHALCLLDELGGLSRGDRLVISALQDKHPGVRRHAVRLTEDRFFQTDGVQEGMVNDPDPQVRLQLACSMARWAESQQAGHLLAQLALDEKADAYLTAAVLSSVHKGNVDYVLNGLLISRTAPASLMRPLLTTATAIGRHDALPNLLRAMNFPNDGRYPPVLMSAVTGFLEGLERRGVPLDKAADERTRHHISTIVKGAQAIAGDVTADLGQRQTAVDLLGRTPDGRADDIPVLARLLVPQTPTSLQAATLTALSRIPDERVAQALITAWRGFSPARKGQALDLLLSRDTWQDQLLTALAKGDLPPAQIDMARRQRLLTHKVERVRALAAKVFEGSAGGDRQKVLREYQGVLGMKGTAIRGRELFAKQCANCHRFDNAGHPVGPDLAQVANKSPQFLLAAVLDPNQEVDARYVDYLATTESGRVYTGILSAETATSITLKTQEGQEHVLLRSELDELQSTGKSMMPEGMENGLSKQELADLIAYLTEPPVPAQKADPVLLAKQILDEKLSTKTREAIIARHPELAAELVAALITGLQEGKEEYRRIPWIWRIALAAGRRNDAKQIREILNLSLPRDKERLRDWQAVVVGGGLINGISQQNVWPRLRFEEIFKTDQKLRQRWQRALPLASAMADNEKIPSGTRYDALRMIALDDWDKVNVQLAKYLAQEDNAELQMGAISGLADMDHAKVAPLLVASMKRYNAGNRRLAIDALLKNEGRTVALLVALEQEQIRAVQLSDAHRKTLRNLKNEMLRKRALKVIGP
jgi:putative membrane-bound dehydrogenase-like protein